jgi:hypothetical protein
LTPPFRRRGRSKIKVVKTTTESVHLTCDFMFPYIFQS